MDANVVSQTEFKKIAELLNYSAFVSTDTCYINNIMFLLYYVS